MKRLALILTLTLAFPLAAETLNVIRGESSIGFVGEKIIGKKEGTFGKFDGKVTTEKGKPVAVDFTIDVATVKTDSGGLDSHLKSADFFDVANHPTATFKSTKITPAGDNAYDIEGLFTLRGNTNPIRFRATTTPDNGKVRVNADFSIDRQKWGVAYAGAPDNLIKDDVAIKLALVFPAR